MFLPALFIGSFSLFPMQSYKCPGPSNESQILTKPKPPIKDINPSSLFLFNQLFSGLLNKTSVPNPAFINALAILYAILITYDCNLSLSSFFLFSK